MKKIIIYINSDYYHIIDKNIKTYNSQWIKDGEVTSKNEFVKELKTNIKKDKLFNKVLPFNLIVYLNKDIEEKDEIYYQYIFDDFNIQSLKLKSIKEIIDNKIYIIVTNNTYIIMNKDNIFTIPKNYFKLPKNQDIYVLGTMKNDQKTTKIYYISNYNDYFANKIKNSRMKK